MPSERDKTKRWQFGLPEVAVAVSLLCAAFSTMQIGLGWFVIFVPLWLVIFLAMIGRQNEACLILVAWIPVCAIAVCAIALAPHS